jgi:4-hydroxybenzoate polyprenyltransferase
MMTTIRRLLEELKIEHTLFALPFAYVGAILAARGIPSFHVLVWVTLAVLGARTAAMAANRLLDARMDARNPRTAQRFVASGRLPASTMLWSIAAGLAVLTVSAWQLNPLCLALLPIGGGAVLLYPLVKRWTWAVHFVLGAVDGLAPLGAWIAVTGRFEAAAFVLFAAVTLWVAGFDILYALMDREFDVREGIRSIPARFGPGASRTLPALLHALVVAALALLGIVAGAHPIYWLGVVFAGVLLLYERRLIVRQNNLPALNAAIFNANMTFSVAFFLSTTASVLTA